MLSMEPRASKKAAMAVEKLEEQICHPYQLLVWSPELLLQGQHDRWEDHTKMTGQSIACHG